MKIYLDDDFKCHLTNDGTLREVETEWLDSYCNQFIEGCRYIPLGEQWTRDDGIVFNGECVLTFKDVDMLMLAQSAADSAQAQAQQTINEYEQALTEIETALGVASK